MRERHSKQLQLDIAESMLSLFILALLHDITLVMHFVEWLIMVDSITETYPRTPRVSHSTVLSQNNRLETSTHTSCVFTQKVIFQHKVLAGLAPII